MKLVADTSDALDTTSDALIGGLMLERVEIRRLLKQLEKWNARQVQPAQGCNIVVAQLRGVLKRRGWKRVALSATSKNALRATGLTIGIVEAKR